MLYESVMQCLQDSKWQRHVAISTFFQSKVAALKMLITSLRSKVRCWKPSRGSWVVGNGKVIRGSTCPNSLFSSFSFLAFLESYQLNAPTHPGKSGPPSESCLRTRRHGCPRVYGFYEQQNEKHVSKANSSVTIWRLRWRPSWTQVSTLWRIWAPPPFLSGVGPSQAGFSAWAEFVWYNVWEVFGHGQSRLKILVIIKSIRLYVGTFRFCFIWLRFII